MAAQSTVGMGIVTAARSARGRRAQLAPMTLAAVCTVLLCRVGVRGIVNSQAAFASGTSAAPALLSQPVRNLRTAAVGRRATVEADVVSEGDGSVSLAKLEQALEAQIVAAKESNNPQRLKELGRLLVLAKTAEGIAVTSGAKEVSSRVREAVASSLTSFVGKEDYDIQDVTNEIRSRVGKAVKALDDIYFEDIAREMDLAAQAAVASFTGKEDYEFGDVTKEVQKRAKESVAKFTGKEKYEFGDITKEALKRGGDAVKGFTGKDEYKFGDITKAALKKMFGGDDK